MTVEYGWGGLTRNRTVHEYLFGWIDETVSMMKYMDPQTGGNPSFPNCVLLNDPNITIPGGNGYWTTCANFDYYSFLTNMQTGKKNLSSVRYYNSIYNYPYITMNFTWFDGINVINATVTPWDGNVALWGTDGVMNQPLEKSNGGSILPTFITTSYCGPNMTSNGSHDEIFGLKTLVYIPNASFWQSVKQYPPNSLYYQL